MSRDEEKWFLTLCRGSPDLHTRSDHSVHHVKERLSLRLTVTINVGITLGKILNYVNRNEETDVDVLFSLLTS